MNNSRILLVYPKPDEVKDWRFGFSLNLLYLAAILKKAGYEVSYLDFSIEPFNENDFIFQANQSNVVIIEFDAYPLKRTLNIKHGESLIHIIRNSCPNTKIIAVGYDLILAPRSIYLADYTFNYEPEATIAQAVASVQTGSKNICESLPQDNLDWLPFPERNLLSAWAETGGNIKRPPNLAKSTLIQTSRGCQSSCRFCQRHGWFKHFRAHSVDYSINEFRDIHEHGYANVWIIDDNFCFNLPRTKEILYRIANEVKSRNWKLALSSWVKIDYETVDLCKAAGVSIISFGIETITPKIQEFYKKHIDLRHAKDIIRYADKIGIYTVGNFILGAPMETEKTIQDSLEFAHSIPLDQVNVKILDYMIGSELWENIPISKRHDHRHYFACSENGLCNFPLQWLKERAREFESSVTNGRKTALMKKIKEHGPPYFGLREDGSSSQSDHNHNI